MSEYREQGLVFNSGNNRLVGVVAIPEHDANVGVLIMVGGPQYRVGSHRQFTLLARGLTAAGFPSLRFDYSGMGDSEGDRLGFEKTGEDVSAAIDAFIECVPGVARVVLWGLCDAASSAMMLAHRDSRVKGMVLLNPWVHTGEYSPEVKLSHFYRPLFTDQDHWRRLFSGKIQLLPALKELVQDALALLGKLRPRGRPKHSQRHFIDEMLEGFQRFQYDVLLILSENDLTAKEFTTLVSSDKNWKSALHKPGVEVHTITGADHTFSQRSAQEQVSQMTIEWVGR
jgi:exosortase A-associated hydrolase 1